MPGTVKDYEDIITRYYKGELSFEEYSKAFEERTKELDRKINTITEINKKILSNTT